MTEAIISRDTIRARARAAFARGAGRDDHNMNPGSAAIADWQAEWDRMHAVLMQNHRRMGSGRQIEAGPP